MNNKDNFEISQELEQMRRQFSILSKKVEEQNIVTDGILRSCAREKMAKYNSKAIWWPIFFWIAVGGWLVHKQIDFGMPEWCNILTTCVCVVEVALFAYKKVLQNRTLDYNENIKCFSQNVKALKSRLMVPVILSNAIGHIWAVVWMWVFFSMYPLKSAVGIILLIVYVVVMTILNFRMEIKLMRILDEIIDDIEK